MNSGVPGSGTEYHQFSRANCVKKGAMFGFALGMLAGLIWIGIAPPEAEASEMGPVSIIRWRNVILVGIGIGLVMGALWPKPKETSASSSESSTSNNS